MFEYDFKDLKAGVWIESRDADLSFQYGIAALNPGNNILTSLEAMELIRKFDRLQINVPKRLQKRWHSIRMQLSFAFGPEMEERLNES